MNDQATIFALSSGQVPSGIAILRVSGPRAGNALQSLAGCIPDARHARRVTFRDADGKPIDDGLVLWFPSPYSATGEDVAELHCHGGRAIIAALVGVLSALDGLRPAEPGEFSRRAFENGKLDLVGAEALDDLIHADTEAQRRQALRQLNGLLGDRARAWRQQIIDASALVEAGIDFADEGDIGDDPLLPAREMIAKLKTEIDDVLRSSGSSERLRDGLVVAILGRPNVGKSSLLNRLARREVAIVTPHAGTTRDALDVQLDLGGYPITLIDTAGLRDTADPIEHEGIRRAKARAATADLVLWLTDRPETVAISTEVSGPIWIVRTKIDLDDPDLGQRIGPDHAISVITDFGLDRLIQALARFAAERFPADAGLIGRVRHRQLLVSVSHNLELAHYHRESELVAEALRGATHALGRLLGRVDVEDVLGAIFSRFCIGK